ncbi:mRNA splicing protein [Mycoemilia scoparia]|uniref:Pre-mRNA-splicing factor SLU7 n=1 Tax=Mycoemilia scoparia TaxID=417184 RepID=A0A9W8A4X3_9FUNG|nr:mRNA splicing protein [Mycoemilia scoparia]
MAGGKLNREEYRKKQDLEAARKAGTAPAEVDEDGHEINPHIPQFMAQAPWYMDTGKPSLKHQRPLVHTPKTKIGDLKVTRGLTTGPAAKRYRKGACENCGAITHKTKDCVDRPRKKGARWTNRNIKPDEAIVKPKEGYDAKRDQWDDFVMIEWELIDEARKKKKAGELDKAIASGSMADLEKQFGSSDEDDGDEDKYADKEGMPGQKVDTKSRTTVRNLRIREDTAKYLRNLDLDSAYYDPKTRSMRENPYVGKDPKELDYAGDNFTRYTGDAVDMTKTQMFSWEASERGNISMHLQANPTQTSLMNREVDSKKEKLKEATRNSILDKYGGEVHLSKPPEGLITQDEHYVEYSRTGRVIRGQEKSIPKSKYQEDVYIGHHSSVWGSWWNDGKWGYKCCLQTMKNAYCTRQP